MRAALILGIVSGLLVGGVLIGVTLASITSQPTVVASLAPFTTPMAMATRPPTPSATPPPLSSPTATPGPGESLATGTAIGQQAPDFVLPHLAGGEIGTADSRGKPVWVNFTTTWASHAEEELPMMMQMRLDLDDAIDFIVVDVGEDEETITNLTYRLGVDLPIALDTDGAVQRQWGAFALPVHYWLDGNGVVQEIVYGGAPREVFEAAVLKVVPEAEFSEP